MDKRITLPKVYEHQSDWYEHAHDTNVLTDPGRINQQEAKTLQNSPQ